MEILEREPETFIAGDTVQWRRFFSPYPASAWELVYTFVNAGGRKQVSAAADGDAHLSTISATDSAAWTPGRYDWQASLTKDDARVTVGAGHVIVEPNFATAENGLDARSYARKVLDAIDARINGQATKNQLDVIDMQIGIRRLSRNPEGLLKLRGLFATRVWQEEHPGEFGPTITGVF